MVRGIAQTINRFKKVQCISFASEWRETRQNETKTLKVSRAKKNKQRDVPLVGDVFMYNLSSMVCCSGLEANQKSLKTGALGKRSSIRFKVIYLHKNIF